MDETTELVSGQWLVAHRRNDTGSWYVGVFGDEEDALDAFDDLADEGHSAIGPYPISETLAEALADDDAERVCELMELVALMLHDAEDIVSDLVPEDELVDEVD